MGNDQNKNIAKLIARTKKNENIAKLIGKTKNDNVANSMQKRDRPNMIYFMFFLNARFTDNLKRKIILKFLGQALQL